MSTDRVLRRFISVAKAKECCGFDVTPLLRGEVAGQGETIRQKERKKERKKGERRKREKEGEKEGVRKEGS